MVPANSSFSAALDELERLERDSTPGLTVDHSADTSYASSSFSATDDNEPGNIIGQDPIEKPDSGSLPRIELGTYEENISVQMGQGWTKAAVGSKLRTEIVIGHTASGVEVSGKEAQWDYQAPVMSKRDVQLIRDILSGDIKSLNHLSTGVGVGGFLSLAPEWQT